MARRNYKHHEFIDTYMKAVLTGKVKSGKRLKKAMKLVDTKLSKPDVFIDSEKIYKAKELIEKYFEMTLFPWELFVLALVHCYYKKSDTVIFREFLIVMGRGNGKNGFISGLAWYLTTPNHGVAGYNVDIIANSEDQAKTSFGDIYEMLDRTWTKTKKFYYKSKVLIESLKTKSYIQYNTSNARTKDGKRSACLIFDEEHEYENEDNIKVFSSGFGKRKHSRKFKITTQGYVRDGVLDSDLRVADDILDEKIKDLSILPLIYEIDEKAQAKNKKCWEMANPSLPYLPELKKELEAALIESEYKTSVEEDFYTKRMNYPLERRETAVTDWENLMAASTPVPLEDMKGWDCVCGIDFALLSDMASIGLLFRDGDKRYWIQHSWISRQSKSFKLINWPEQKLIKDDVTFLDEPQINPLLMIEWLQKKMEDYNILTVSIDLARFSLVRELLEGIGFSQADKTIWIVRPLGIATVATMIDYWFSTGLIAWGGGALMRWAANNVKKVPMKENGNFKYGKIEEKSRKTDPFMAFAHAAVKDDLLDGENGNTYEYMPVMFF